MNKILLAIFASALLLLSVFFISKTAGAFGVSIVLNKPAHYNPSTGVQTICMGKGYLAVEGALTVAACSNNPPRHASVDFSLTPLNPIDAVDANGNPTGIPDETKTMPLGSVSLIFNANVASSFSGLFIVGSSCNIMGPADGAVMKGGNATFNLTYKNMGGIPSFEGGYPVCSGGTLVSSSCNSSGCTFTCNYPSEGSFSVSSQIKTATKSAICSTEITVAKLGDPNCVLNASVNRIIQNGASQTFSWNYSNMGSSGVVNFLGGPICGDGAVLSGTPICIDSGGGSGTCTFTCNDYNVSGSYLVDAQIKNTTAGTSAECSTQINVASPYSPPEVLPLGFYNVKVSSTMTFCPKGDGSCTTLSADDSNIILLSDCNCPEGYTAKQDGICIKSTQSPILYPGVCPSGFISQDGICLKSTVDIAQPGNCNSRQQCTQSGTGPECMRDSDCSNYATCGVGTGGNMACFVGGGGAYCSVATECEPALPRAKNLKVVPDYCVASESGSLTFSWEYEGAVGTIESGFDFEIDDDANFSSPKIRKSYDGSSSTSQQFYVVASSDAPNTLTYSSTYYWRVKVYGSNGEYSGWYYGGTTITPTAPPGVSFTTPAHAYPYPLFTLSASSATLVEGVVSIIFTDSSTCYTPDEENPSYSCNDEQYDNNYSWWFEMPSSTQDIFKYMQNNTPNTTKPAGDPPIVSHDYSKYNIYKPLLRVCDDAGCCLATGTLRIVDPRVVPEWKEISPF